MMACVCVAGFNFQLIPVLELRISHGIILLMLKCLGKQYIQKQPVRKRHAVEHQMLKMCTCCVLQTTNIL